MLGSQIMDGKQGQIDYYEGLLAKHGDSFLALDWNSPESQRLRYRIFKEIFVYGRKASNPSVLDVGCGFGDLFGFFKAERIKVQYTGFEISPKLIEIARKKHPDGRFELKDILAERSLPQFDYLFCSGVFNIRMVDRGSHLEFVKSMLQRMHDLARYGVAANFLSEGALPLAAPEELNTGRYYYFKPEEILGFCRFIAGRFILRHDYHPGDFTVYLLK